jgi:Arc/MetJ family transcription regulator
MSICFLLVALVSSSAIGVAHSYERIYCACVRTTISLDDELVGQAQAFTGIDNKSLLVKEALKALIERESGRRLAHLGGSERKLKTPPRRRTSQS